MQWVDRVCVFRLVATYTLMAVAVPAQTTVKSESAPVYSKTDTGSAIVQTLKKGTAVEIEFSIWGEDNAQWCSIREPSQKRRLGYVRCESLARPPASKTVVAPAQAAPVQSAAPGAVQQVASRGFWEPGHKETLGESRYLGYARILATNFGFSQDQKDQSLQIAHQTGLLGCIEDTDSFAGKGLTPPDLLRTPRSRTTQCDWTHQAFIEQVFALVTPEQQASHRAAYKQFSEDVDSHRRALETNPR